MNESTTSLNVRTVDHITLVVSNLVATTEFYVQSLGMEEMKRPAFDFPGAWYQLGSFQIHATVTDEASGRAGWPDGLATRISRGHHFAFVVSNFDKTLASLENLGIEIADGPKVRPDGARQVYIYDPDRHLIELCTKN